jgi:hypothetical protein
VANALLSSYLCSLKYAPTLIMFATCWQLTQLLGTLSEAINAASDGLQETKRQSVSAADSWKKLALAVSKAILLA